MKSIFKLTCGELKKIFKGIGVYIMTGILVVAVVLFGWLYESQLGGESIFQKIMNAQKVPDVFDILDGKADDIIGDNFDYIKDLEGVDELLKDGKFTDYFKMILVTNSLKTLVDEMASGEGVGSGESVNPADLSLIKVAASISVYYESSIKAATEDRNNAESEIEFISNNGNFGVSYVEYIERMFVDFAKSWDAYSEARNGLLNNPDYTAALNRYAAVKNLETNLTEAEQTEMNAVKNPADWSAGLRTKFANSQVKTVAYINLLKVSSDFITKSNTLMDDFSRIENYTELNMMGTKYLFYEAKGYYPAAAGSSLKNSISRFEKNARNYESLLELNTGLMSNVDMYANIFEISKDSALTQCVTQDFLRIKDKTATTLLDIEAFMSEAGMMISRQSLDDEFFSGFIDVNPEDFDGKTDLYYAEVMKAQIGNLKESKRAAITQSVFEDMIAPYAVVIGESDELLQEINIIKDKFKGYTSDRKKAESTAMYKELKNDYKAYTSKISTLRLLLQNVNLSNTVEALNYKDKQLTTIYGNQLFGSKYSIRATITESQYFISNGELSIDYVSATTLDKGYGYMNFAWIIIYILILIFGIVIAAGQIAGEHAAGTMKLLLIRPHKRWQVLLSKLLATMIVVAYFLAAAFILSLIVGCFWGYGGAKTALLIFNSTTPIKMAPFWVMTLSYIFGFGEIFVYVLIALMVSTIFKSHAGAVSVSMLIYFLAMVLTTVLGQFEWYKFIVFNNTNLFTYFSSGPSLNDMTFWFSFVVNIVYIAILLFASLFTFQKRDAT